MKAGGLKKEQMLSGDMADIFSNLYLALGVKYYEKNNKVSSILTNYIINRILNENQVKINKIIDNLGYNSFLYQIKKKPLKIDYNDERIFFKEIMNNPKIIEEIKKNIVLKDIIEDLDRVNTLDNLSDDYNKLKDRIINVGEFEIK